MSHHNYPLKHDLRLVYLSSLIIAAVMAVTSITGLLYWGTIYPAAEAANTVGSDAFNLVIVLPILLLALWLARRKSLIGLLLWPGALIAGVPVSAALGGFLTGLPTDASTVVLLPIAVIPFAVLAYFARAAAKVPREKSDLPGRKEA